MARPFRTSTPDEELIVAQAVQSRAYFHADTLTQLVKEVEVHTTDNLYSPLVDIVNIGRRHTYAPVPIAYPTSLKTARSLRPFIKSATEADLLDLLDFKSAQPALEVARWGQCTARVVEKFWDQYRVHAPDASRHPGSDWLNALALLAKNPFLLAPSRAVYCQQLEKEFSFPSSRYLPPAPAVAAYMQWQAPGALEDLEDLLTQVGAHVTTRPQDYNRLGALLQHATTISPQFIDSLWDLPLPPKSVERLRRDLLHYTPVSLERALEALKSVSSATIKALTAKPYLIADPTFRAALKKRPCHAALAALAATTTDPAQAAALTKRLAKMSPKKTLTWLKRSSLPPPIATAILARALVVFPAEYRPEIFKVLSKAQSR